ncbi:hypothetical protein BDV38DRAFT_280234 [Aspergillus pseudotamarii]|uniref:GH18 domain-containing protein n=1 Tax=Aspergillus pseudotamarii TaxID=132259 RepID=A0A5N6T1T0_ASPPS|nr:uncharacterized protein BDV38DRAFT_280234 [Aspergillus pseudotamarii]KAE8140239.1 hypothetical protein BDV38DRAFT_280234 [Aspergillus pseudotamarii]
MATVGSAAQGSFAALDNNSTFKECYQNLSSMLKSYRFDGIDLDIEEPISQSGISRWINHLYDDFGPSFEVSTAATTLALQSRALYHFSQLNYSKLEHGHQH